MYSYSRRLGWPHASIESLSNVNANGSLAASRDCRARE